MPTTTKSKTTKPAARSAEPKEKPESTTPKTGEAPEWVNETPDDTDYTMNMWDSDGGCGQEFHMTRGEFIRLKRWLAALRGYDLRSPVDSYTADRLRGKSAEEQKAAALNISQEEIDMLMDIERVAAELCNNFVRRLRLGAEVEPGTWGLEDDGAEINQSNICGMTKNGLTVLQVEEVKTGAAGA